MNRFLEKAKAMQDEIVQNRRFIHKNAELGFDLFKTREYVERALASYGYEVKALGAGLSCTVGSGSPVLLLRADMDALPQTEESGEEFACTTGACHSCGHDAHTAMLLGAAKLLKAHEAELKGTVKFMFQAGEETLKGSQRMIDAGILENPKVDAAMGFHMNFGPCGEHDLHPGTIVYSEGAMLASADEFRITVKGKSSHGSMPFLGVSALSIAANIIVALQQLITLEVPGDETAVMTIGALESGVAANIIPGDAVIRGSFRTHNRDIRDKLVKRVPELAEAIANAWNGTTDFEYVIGVDPNVNNTEMAKEMGKYLAEVAKKVELIKPVLGSEDFANLGRHVPTFFANVCAGDPSDGYSYAMHNPKMRLDENALPYGVAAHCNCAVNWLANHSK